MDGRLKAHEIAYEIASTMKREEEAVADLISRVNPKDLPHVLLRLSSSDRRRLLSILPDEALAKLVVEAPAELLIEVANSLGGEGLAKIVEALPLDEASEVLSKLPLKERKIALKHLPGDRLRQLEPLLMHSPGTVGALMVTQVPVFKAAQRVEEAAREFALKAGAGAFYVSHHVYVVDDEGGLVGMLSSAELLTAPKDRLLKEVARPPRKAINVRASCEEAALTMVRYDLMELPVVDDRGKLLGALIFEDAVGVLLDSHSKDLELFGGFFKETRAPYLAARTGSLIKKRASTLILLCLLEALTVSVLSHFESALAKVVALSFFIPLLCDIGGNSGSQSASFVIRSLATGDVVVYDALRIAFKEAVVSLGLGLTLSPVLFALGYITAQDARIAALLSVVVVVIVFVASMVGSLLPLLSVKLGVDPAATSAPLLTTIADIVGLTLYFTMALWLLSIH